MKSSVSPPTTSNAPNTLEDLQKLYQKRIESRLQKKKQQNRKDSTWSFWIGSFILFASEVALGIVPFANLATWLTTALMTVIGAICLTMNIQIFNPNGFGKKNVYQTYTSGFTLEEERKELENLITKEKATSNQINSQLVHYPPTWESEAFNDYLWQSYPTQKWPVETKNTFMRKLKSGMSKACKILAANWSLILVAILSLCAVGAFLYFCPPVAIFMIKYLTMTWSPFVKKIAIALASSLAFYLSKILGSKFFRYIDSNNGKIEDLKKELVREKLNTEHQSNTLVLAAHTKVISEIELELKEMMSPNSLINFTSHLNVDTGAGPSTLKNHREDIQNNLKSLINNLETLKADISKFRYKLTLMYDVNTKTSNRDHVVKYINEAKVSLLTQAKTINNLYTNYKLRSTFLDANSKPIGSPTRPDKKHPQLIEEKPQVAPMKGSEQDTPKTPTRQSSRRALGLKNQTSTETPVNSTFSKMMGGLYSFAFRPAAVPTKPFSTNNDENMPSLH